MTFTDDKPVSEAVRETLVPEASDGAATTIIVCSSCRNEDNDDSHPRPGLLFGDEVRKAAAKKGIAVEQVECLANCKRRLSAAMAKPGGWTYVFGDLGSDDAEDLVEGARLYRESGNGLIPWRGRPDCLKRGLVARIPPQTFNGSDK
ncbi:MAG: DUF1636 family protein [Rhizobiaceae bacterium]